MIFSLIIAYYIDYEVFKGIVLASFYDGSILNEIAKNINPFSKLNSNDMTAGLFIYKITISYLIYQFIISIRQNTRRK